MSMFNVMLKNRLVCALFSLVLLLFEGCPENSDNNSSTTFENENDHDVGDGSVNGSNDNIPLVKSEIQLDTLCDYFYAGRSGKYVFQNDSQLTDFLDSTKYNGTALKPDFSKSTYFAIAGTADWSMGNISERDDTLTINYTRICSHY